MSRGEFDEVRSPEDGPSGRGPMDLMVTHGP